MTTLSYLGKKKAEEKRGQATFSGSLNNAEGRSLIDEIPIELPKDWGRYVDEFLPEKELNRLRQDVNRHSPYGILTWQMKVSKELGLESTLRPWGRPKKGLKREEKK